MTSLHKFSTLDPERRRSRGSTRPLLASAAGPLERATTLLRERTGICVPEYRLAILVEVLDQLGEGRTEHGLERMIVEHEAFHRVVHALTVPETYLFRHPGHFEILAQLARECLASGSGCRVLSAGCSTGEEVWSAAVVLARVYRPDSGRFSVLGWDIDPQRLDSGRQGFFRPWSSRGGLMGYQGSFRSDPQGLRVNEELHPFVRFQPMNLVGRLSGNDVFDVIFFRNVAIYWQHDTVRQVAQELGRRLRPGGLLLVGPSDPVELDPRLFQSAIHQGTRFFRRRLEPLTGPSPDRSPSLAGSSPTERAHRGERPRDQAPRRGARRTPSTTLSPTPSPPRQVPAAGIGESDTFRRARDLADAGDFDQALGLLRDHRHELPPALRLLRGVLELETGDATAALASFRQVVFLEEPSHRHWLAIALETLGHHDQARRERRNARDSEPRP